jgi:hypothetical protein
MNTVSKEAILQKHVSGIALRFKDAILEAMEEYASQFKEQDTDKDRDLDAPFKASATIEQIPLYTANQLFTMATNVAEWAVTNHDKAGRQTMPEWREWYKKYFLNGFEAKYSVKQ